MKAIMKNLFILIFFLQINTFCFAQILNDIDGISPFQDDIAAVKKGNQWGFVNKKGELVINYRDDLVVEKSSKNEVNIIDYPIFKDGRCLFKKMINDIFYYGYIDVTGKEIIPPQFLNATNFVDGYAIIIAPSNDIIGFNKILKKDIVSSNIEEFVINISGERVRYLENPIKYDSSKRKSKAPPMFHSKFIGPHLVAVQKKDLKWDVYEF